VTRRWQRSARGRRMRAAKTARSTQSMCGLGLVRRSTATSCRSTRSSTSLVEDARPISRISPSTCRSDQHAQRHVGDHARLSDVVDHRRSTPVSEFWNPTGVRPRAALAHRVTQDIRPGLTALVPIRDLVGRAVAARPDPDHENRVGQARIDDGAALKPDHSAIQARSGAIGAIRMHSPSLPISMSPKRGRATATSKAPTSTVDTRGGRCPYE
jgi:hypothetical protein